ncbi:MAG: alanine racemase [Oscillospiraceae bacterium]|jgi:alanine racemase|nr:alanine racemase [Oscillospiraceae bacterium]
MNLLVIEKQKMRQNLTLCKQRARGAVIYGVLKGDAYGLGLVETARLMRDEGVTRFAVGHPREGALLRREGFAHEEILLLRSTADPEEIETLLEAGLVASVGSRDAAVALSGLAEKRGTVAEAHLKIDTGLGRYGFLPEEFDKIQSVYQYMNGVAVAGVYTHLNAYAGARGVKGQMERFKALLTRMQSAGLETGVIHAAGSTALFRYDLPRLDAVRIGRAVSGRLPGKGYGLQPVGFAECPIAELSWLPKGHRTGSSETYRFRRNTRVGVLPIGTADGFQVGRLKRLPFLSLRGLFPKRIQVGIGAERARVLGSVGLEHTVIDCQNVSCAVGDLVRVDLDPVFAGRLPKRYV